MSDKQKAAVNDSLRVRTYTKINALWGLLPDRFFTGDLEKLAGFGGSMQQRALIAVILEQDFHCAPIKARGRWAWRKPV